jgi:hypothetical protein
MNQSSLSSEPRVNQGLRRLLGKLPRAAHTTYSPEEVRLRLQKDELADPRTAAVHAAAAQTALWSCLVSDKVAADLGPAANRLPTIVHWYRQGVSPHVIGRRLSPFGGAWDADHALAVAAALIAYILNQGG